MSRRIDISQWRDHTEEPVIVWAYTGVWELEPVAVDDSHEADIYDEYTRAWYAAGYYQTAEELEENASWYDLTAEELRDILDSGDDLAQTRAGLPRMYYAEGVNEDGSDAIIYVDEETQSQTHRESLEEATPHLDPEDVAEIYRAMLEARKEYDR